VVDHASEWAAFDALFGNEVGPRIHTLWVRPTSAVLHRFMGDGRRARAQGGSAMTTQTTQRHPTEAVASWCRVSGIAGLRYPVR
jgi:hypothetical protein